MKFKIKCKHVGEDEEWWESYNKSEILTLEDAQKWADKVIKSFNHNLRKNEKERELLDVQLDSTSSVVLRHTWEKTNLVTVFKRGEYYDTYRCTHCGVTGKRYSLNGAVIRDTKYKAKVYGDCAKSKKKLSQKNNSS
jgi:hypothetical protein